MGTQKHLGQQRTSGDTDVTRTSGEIDRLTVCPRDEMCPRGEILCVPEAKCVPEVIPRNLRKISDHAR